MGMRVVSFNRYHNHLTVAHAALGNHFIGEGPNLLRFSFEQRHLKATAVIKMDMQTGERQVMVIVEGASQAA